MHTKWHNKCMIAACTLLWSVNVMASETAATFGYSYVLFTNNTNEAVSIDTSLTTTDTTFKRGDSWDGGTLSLAPYETKQVLWFGRNVGLHQGEKYHFSIMANQQNYPGQNITFSFDVTAKAIFGSDVITKAAFPDQSSLEILSKNELRHLPVSAWNADYTISARSWLPFGRVFNNYHFVITKNEKTVIDTTSNEKISVLTYNTQLMPFYAGAVDKLNNPSIRANDIAPKIADYDVVVMEELFDRDLRNTMIGKMTSYYPYHTNVVGHDTGNVLTGGVIIFSKWPITHESQIVFNASSGIDALAAKGVIAASINKNGKNYHIVGTHLQAGDDADSVRARQKQLLEMVAFINQLNIPSQEPLLLAGDFNIDQFSNSYNDMLGILNATSPVNTGYAYSSDNVVNTMNVGSSKTRLDYVLFSNSHINPIVATNTVYILRDLENENMWPAFDLSDHFPTRSYFDFSEKFTNG